MRTFVMGLVAAAALAIGAAAAGGATTTTYQGTFTGAVDYSTCPTWATGTVQATGTWSVALHGTSTATVAFNIFLQEDGAKRMHHVAYGGTFEQIYPPENGTWEVSFPAGLNTVDVYLTGSTLTYRVDGYYFGDFACQGGSVIYTGTTS